MLSFELNWRRWPFLEASISTTTTTISKPLSCWCVVWFRRAYILPFMDFPRIHTLQCKCFVILNSTITPFLKCRAVIKHRVEKTAQWFYTQIYATNVSYVQNFDNSTFCNSEITSVYLLQFNMLVVVGYSFKIAGLTILMWEFDYLRN